MTLRKREQIILRNKNMKHRHGNRILGRVATDRKQLLMNLCSSLLEHGSIVTSEAKAKELRKFIEPLITKAKREESLHVRRQLLSVLSRKADVGRLLSVARANAARPGGYLRLTHLPVTRGDAASQMRIDIIDYGN